MNYLKLVSCWFICLVLSFVILSVVPTDALAGEKIRINGTGTGVELFKPLTEEYLKLNQDILFEIEKPLGSSGAVKALIAGALDIAVISKTLNPDEAAQGIKLHYFGKTPLVIVTGSNVPVKEISTLELEEIYSGRTRKWSNGENIRVVLRPLADTGTKILRGLSTGMGEAVTLAQSRRGMVIAMTDPESNRSVANMVGSIGTAGLTNVLIEKRALKILSLNGIMPTTASLADESYPLAKELFFATKEQISESEQKFLDFICSERGRAIAENLGVLTSTGAK